MPSVEAWKFLRGGCVLSLVGLLAACGTTAVATAPVQGTQQLPVSDPNTLATPDAVPLAPSPVQLPAALPTAAATSNGPLQLNTALLIWWPAGLYPAPESPAADVITGQIDGYTKVTGTTITVRVKRNDGVGSIFETLSSGSIAAPSVMPDLALMRRDDLIQAIAGKLVEPLDLKALALNDIYPSGLALGQVNGIQYGLPYALEVQHTVYRSAAFTSPPQSASDLINGAQPLLFAAGTPKGVNSTFLQQYLAAGGTLEDNKGAPTLDISPLRDVLHYYEQAVAAKIVGPLLLDYTSAAQYWPVFLTGKNNVVEIDSTTYLSQKGSLTNIGVAPILMPTELPTSAVPAISDVDGWLWVVTTPNADRQTLALTALTWFMAADHLAAFTQAFGVLPSRRTALASWKDTKYSAFAGTLLDAKALPAPDLIDPGLATAMQKAFEDVLSGRKTADSAANDALAQITVPK